MAQCRTAVSLSLTNWRYCILALSHRYIHVIGKTPLSIRGILSDFKEIMFPHQYIKGPGFVSDDAIDLIQNAAALFGVKSFKNWSLLPRQSLEWHKVQSASVEWLYIVTNYILTWLYGSKMLTYNFSACTTIIQNEIAHLLFIKHVIKANIWATLETVVICGICRMSNISLGAYVPCIRTAKPFIHKP